MNKTTFLLALLALSPAADAASVPDAQYRLQLDPYSVYTVDYSFPSGLRILFQEDHTQPIVSVTNWFDRGSVYDGVNANGESVEGIAHAVEHLAFRARHADLPKNWDVINQLGGVLNASTSREWTNYMTVAPVDAAIPLLRIEALRMDDGVANVTEADVEAEKAIVRNELRMGYESGANGSPAIRTALVHVPKLLYPEGHLYRNTTIGTHETISNIDLASVQRYVSENYRPEYATIAMVGDFELDDGQGFQMILDAFAGVEHLLMEPEDAEKYEALTTDQERDVFFAEWFEQTLVPFMQNAAGKPPEPRVDCENKIEPPAELASDEIMRVKGMVDYPTVIAAWSLPSGYCADDVNMNIAANQLSGYIARTLDPEYDPLSQESEIEGFGCFVDADKRGSVLLCFVEQGSMSKDKPERILDKIADSLYLQTQPIDQLFKPFYEQNMEYSRLYALSSVLSSTDNVASLYGRSFYVSQHAHYTGSPKYFSETIQGYNTINYDEARRIGGTYVTRDRMARLIIEPIDEEERERLEASASEADKENNVEGEHRASDDSSRQLFDPSLLTADEIKKVTVVPDLNEARILELDNGLEVVIMNHGEAPLVKVGLQVNGNNLTSPEYMLDTFTHELFNSAVESNKDSTQNPLAIAGDVGRNGRNMIYASGSSANLDALMHKMRWHLEDIDWQMADKGALLRHWSGQAKGGKKPESWATRIRNERLYPNSPYGRSLSPSDVEAAQGWNKADAQAWLNTKWQPANARLVVVGKINDMDVAEEQVRRFFGDWEYKGDGQPGPVAPPPIASEQPERQILLFDKPISTQSKVQLTCQLDKPSPDNQPELSVMGEIMSFLAFERLREEKGLTYGAYGYPQSYWGGTSQLIIASVIQNSGVAFGIQTMFDLVDEGATGKFDDGLIKTNTWNVARTSVTGIQSGDQMLSALLSPEDLTYFERYPDLLAGVNGEKIAAALQPCLGHEVVTVVGPVEQIEPQLKDAGLAYEVIDWEPLYEANLSKKELKKYRKAKAKAEKKRQDEESNGTTEG